jgi:hypothetical protein
VTTKDHNGNVLHVGGNNINATFKGAKRRLSPVDVKDNNNGTYDASYVPKVVGEYTLAVNLASDGIKDSPFKVQGHSGRAQRRPDTEAHGDGIKARATLTRRPSSRFRPRTRLATTASPVARRSRSSRHWPEQREGRRQR